MSHVAIFQCLMSHDAWWCVGRNNLGKLWQELQDEACCTAALTWCKAVNVAFQPLMVPFWPERASEVSQGFGVRFDRLPGQGSSASWKGFSSVWCKLPDTNVSGGTKFQQRFRKVPWEGSKEGFLGALAVEDITWAYLHFFAIGIQIIWLLFTQIISNPSDDQNSANTDMQKTQHQCFFSELKVNLGFTAKQKFLPRCSSGNCSDVDLLLALVSTLEWRIDELERGQGVVTKLLRIVLIRFNILKQLSSKQTSSDFKACSCACEWADLPTCRCATLKTSSWGLFQLLCSDWRRQNWSSGDEVVI